MNCDQIRDLMPDLAAGLSAATPETSNHLKTCTACAAQLEEFRQTMAMLDEWQVPEPSPYFDVRLQARLREEAARQPEGWLQWFRKPALALSFAVLMVASVTFLRYQGINPPPVIATQAAPGTAVGDLQALDRNSELYSDFDVLDDLQVQPDVNATP